MGDDFTSADDDANEDELVEDETDGTEAAQNNGGKTVSLHAFMAVDVAGQQQVEQVQEDEGQVLLGQNDVSSMHVSAGGQHFAGVLDDGICAAGASQHPGDLFNARLGIQGGNRDERAPA